VTYLGICGRERLTRKQRILPAKSPDGGVVVAGAVVIEAGFGVEFAGSIGVRIKKGAGLGDETAKGIVGVGADRSAVEIGQGRDAAEAVGVVDRGPPLPEHSEGLVDAGTMNVQGLDDVRPVELRGDVLIVVGVAGTHPVDHLLDAAA
jgi:hypothetical protein